MDRNISKKKTLLALILFIALFAALCITYFAARPKAADGTKTITVRVCHLACENTEYVIETDAEYLRAALEEYELISGPETQYGMWVLTVDGETADESRQQWWGYNVNGEFAQYGVDEQVIADGDVYEFILNEGY